MKTFFRIAAFLSIFLAAPMIYSQEWGRRPSPGAGVAITAFPERIWVAPDQPWVMNWQSAVSPSASARAAIAGEPLSDAPISCCRAGQNLRLHVVVPGVDDENVHIDVVRYRPLPAGVRPTFGLMTFGDSLSEIYLPTALKMRLQQLGYDPQMIGTTLDREWNGATEATEGRGGKQIRDMLYMRSYSASDINTVRPVAIGDEASYMALPPSGMSVVSRKYFNPFLRPATGARFRAVTDGNRLLVRAVDTGFVGLGQTLQFHDALLGAKIVGYVGGGKYGGAGEYRLDRPVPHDDGIFAGEECDSCVNNGEVFDVRFYLSRFGLADPDWVLISAGTNDLFRFPPGPAGIERLGAALDDGLRQIHDAFRLALPQSRIVFYNVALGAGTGHDSLELNHRFMLQKTRDIVRDMHDPRCFWINTAIWQSEKDGWWVHPEGTDMVAEARSLAAMIAAEQNPAGKDVVQN